MITIPRRTGRLFAALLATGFALAAAAPAAATRTERLYLSGRGPGDAVDWELQVSAGRRAGEWSTIPVPSQWELHGFGSFRYGMDDPGSDEEGRYRVRFTTPAHWTGRRVLLVFEGCMTDCAPALDGAPLLPVHRGGYTRFRYDVSDRIRPGEESLLEVLVGERSNDASVERAEREADYWLFGGIYRPVYLEATPLPAIDRVRIDARHDGRLAIEVEVVARPGAEEDPATIAAEVRERWSGAPVHRFSLAVHRGVARAAERLAAVRAWSAEEPWLYELSLALEPAAAQSGGSGSAAGDASGGASHRTTEVFGFRTFAVVPGEGLLVNGRRVLLKGVNRHSFWPSSGRAIDPARNRADAELLLALNANAVRASHYPPDPEFLRACDELGLYVIDELPGWHDAYDEEVGIVLAREMVARDHNHPSIVAWANGNEGGWNRALDAELGRLDLQRRPVLHPGDLHQGVDASHYPSWSELRASLDPASWRNRLRRLRGALPVVLPTEALHGLYDGGSGAGLEDYWELVRSSPLAGGLFLWSLLDEGVVRGDRGGAIDTFANYGPDGLVGPYRQKEGSFWAVRDIWAPIAVLEPEVALTADGARLSLENRYDLATLRGAELRWEWLRLPGPGGTGETVLGRGALGVPQLAPGARAKVELAGPAAVPHGKGASGDPDALRLRALSRTGREIATWVLPVAGRGRPPGGPSAATRASVGEKSASADPPRSAAGGGAPAGVVVLAAGETRVELDAGRGRLLALERAGRRIRFDAGPHAVGEREPRLVEARRDASGGERLSFRYGGELERVELTLESSGWLRLDYVLALARESSLAGLVLDLREESVTAMRWLGEGPFRVWGNRRRGGRLGVWRVERNGSRTGVDWRYPELGGFYAGVRWATFETGEGDLSVALDAGAGLLLGALTPRFAEGLAPDGETLARQTSVETPGGALAVLHAIPGIGTKFHTADETGPQGASRLPPGRYAGRFWLRLER